MPLTDAQIYEQHPEIAALNSEFVQLGKQLPDMANAVSQAGEALATATEEQRKAIADATAAVQEAEKNLRSVKAAQALAVSKAQAAYDEAESAQRTATNRRREVQKRHNEQMAAVQEAAKAAELDDSETAEIQG